MRILITGARGMVGSALVQTCRDLGDEVFAYDHQSLDIGDRPRVYDAFRTDQPDVCINCAAWTDVDGCETDGARSDRTNAQGPESLAIACRSVGALLITISTDYVFDGHKPGFYTQRDHPNPESRYGCSKLEGERRAVSAWARTIVVRSGFIFGPGGTNFLSSLVARILSGQSLKVIKDARGTPTYSVHLAKRLRELADLDLPTTFHVANSGDGATYEDFAREAMKLIRTEVPIESVEMSQLKRPARRPANSRLRCLFSQRLGLAPLPDWREALREFVTVSTAGAVR